MMRHTIILVAVAVALLAACGSLQPESDAVARAEERARILRVQAETADRIDDLAERRRQRPWRATVGIVGVAVAPALALAGVVLFAHRRRGFATPRADGRLPVRLDQVDPVDAVDLARGIQTRDIAHAANTGVPQSISHTYAPRYTNRQDIQGGDPPAVAATPPPAFSALALATDTVYLGHHDGGSVIRPWDDLLSVAIGGATGSGKTWTAASIVLQAIHAGHRVAICDPHAASADSLAGRLTPVADVLWRPVAATDDQIAGTVAAVDRLLTARAHGDDRDLTPVTLVVDEFTRVMRGDLADTASRILEGVVQEGRKLGVRVVLLGQRWSASRTGGSGDLRDSIPHVLLHRMRRADARMISGWPLDDIPDTSRLQPGEAYLLDGDDVIRVSQPVMSDRDVAAFAAAQTAGGAIGTPQARHGRETPVDGSAPTVRPRSAHGPPTVRPRSAHGPAHGRRRPRRGARHVPGGRLDRPDRRRARRLHEPDRPAVATHPRRRRRHHPRRTPPAHLTPRSDSSSAGDLSARARAIRAPPARRAS